GIRPPLVTGVQTCALPIFARGPMELSRQLGSGGAGADDGDVQLSGMQRTRLRICANARIYESMVEAHGLLGCLERNRVSAHPRRTEIIGNATDRDDQRVIM